MNYDDFIEQPAGESEELDVQKAVVEALAADKAEQNEKIGELTRKNDRLISEISDLKGVIATLKEELGRVGDILAKNSETPLSSRLAVLERDEAVPDRFEGETRDHLIEVIREAREIAEHDGRLRRAQLLEAVLAKNEAGGLLQKKRDSLIKLFNDNQNILSGPVINELDKQGISYKNGENYLLADEIIKKMY